MARLNEYRVPAAPVLSAEEAINHPHLRQRGTVTRMYDQVLGEIDLPGFPLKFSAFPKDLKLSAPTLGEHNKEILERYLGYGSDRIEELKRTGALHSKPT